MVRRKITPSLFLGEGACDRGRRAIDDYRCKNKHFTDPKAFINIPMRWQTEIQTGGFSRNFWTRFTKLTKPTDRTCLNENLGFWGERSETAISPMHTLLQRRNIWRDACVCQLPTDTRLPAGAERTMVRNRYRGTQTPSDHGKPGGLSQAESFCLQKCSFEGVKSAENP